MAKVGPQGKDGELDPELVSLRRTRARIGPVLAASVLILCVYLIVITRHDLMFAASGARPVELGDARAAAAAGKVPPENGYVRYSHLQPDLRQIGWLLGNQASGHRLMPVLGTSQKLWLQITDDVYSPAPVYDLAFVGRSRSVRELVFASELADYVKALPPEPRVIAPSELASGAPKVDVFGDTLALQPSDPVTLDERVPGVALVTLYGNDHVKDEISAHNALTAANLAPTRLVRQTDRSWTYELPAPSGLDALRDAIAEADIYAAMAADAVAEEIVRHEGTYADIDLSGVAATHAIKLQSGETIAVANVVRMTARVKPALPADAMVLVVGETPDAYWYLFVLDGVLALVALAMIWALIRGFRDGGHAPDAPLIIRPPDAPTS